MTDKMLFGFVAECAKHTKQFHQDEYKKYGEELVHLLMKEKVKLFNKVSCAVSVPVILALAFEFVLEETAKEVRRDLEEIGKLSDFQSHEN